MPLEKSALSKKKKSKGKSNVYYVSYCHVLFMHLIYMISYSSTVATMFSISKIKEQLKMDNLPKSKHLATDVVRIQIQVFLN